MGGREGGGWGSMGAISYQVNQAGWYKFTNLTEKIFLRLPLVLLPTLTLKR